MHEERQKPGLHEVRVVGLEIFRTRSQKEILAVEIGVTSRRLGLYVARGWAKSSAWVRRTRCDGGRASVWLGAAPGRLSFLTRTKPSWIRGDQVLLRRVTPRQGPVLRVFAESRIWGDAHRDVRDARLRSGRRSTAPSSVRHVLTYLSHDSRARPARLAEGLTWCAPSSTASSARRPSNVCAISACG